MKKINLLYALGVALAMGSTVSSHAQELKEFYGRPTNWRAYDQTGINQFETKKTADIPFEGPRFRIGAGFTQQWQNLKHENPGSAVKLYPLASGFMTSQANLYTDVQLADGIRLNVTSYLSARHHNETWVKGGYIQFDKLPFKSAFFNKLMENVTVKVGHMEINYGDAHFRRSDGGQTLYNPFADNYIVDAFTTEIGGEAYYQKNGFIGMLGVTGGMIKGNVDSVDGNAMANGKPVIADKNGNRNPSIYGKLGYDNKVAENVRLRVTGSYYHNSSSAGSGLTLYGSQSTGDRTGSNYQEVMETASAGTANAWSGRTGPGFSKKLDAAMFNAFVKAGGLEFFGSYENASGYAKTESVKRHMKQTALDLVYRFGKAENLFVGARYNTAKIGLANVTTAPVITYNGDVTIDRTAFAAGWFLTKSVLLKGEYVTQKYKDYPTASVFNNGKFNGVVIEAVVGF
ncbi:hypothetical protein OCK74_01850 [Chitinophagaceae bacterium LB-8]|uniref:Porin n=1 Tax=Paraflavisolibacter caeni TaxID=2982496 RepID=A0A9X2XUC3_9BACT|nr:hypothetical protein [Paraflavisolibacter caeni]MCU7547833.1 hypothetical protein [Paraflavisolibacter caeni]